MIGSTEYPKSMTKGLLVNYISYEPSDSHRLFIVDRHVNDSKIDLVTSN